MNIQQLAADIAARVPAMAQDTSINNADLIARLIFHECAGCSEPDKECAMMEEVIRQRVAADACRPTPEKMLKP